MVGASAAGLTAAETLRNDGFTGTITLIGEELHAPYDRPPLSKQVLTGTRQDVALRPDEAIERLGLELRSGCRATGLDLTARTVALAGGDRVRYDGLIVATGLRPRRLPFGHEPAGMHVLRTLDDALALRAELTAGPRVVVLGAGFLGSEIAASARELGLDVALVDAEPAPLTRQFGDEVADLVAELHRDHGVRMFMGRKATDIEVGDGWVAAVVLDDGTRLAADVVVVAVGSTPAVDWLAESGLPIGDGVRCDEYCRAAPGVYAAGDVANWPHPAVGARVRFEQRTNASEQAMAAARNLLAEPGQETPYAPTPFGWTDHYGSKIQLHGWCPAGSRAEIVAGDPRERKFVALYRSGDRIVGALGWNSVRTLREYRGRVTAPGHPAAHGG
ncbi:NAD(P)/FAD-dependent oxidoreductase [Nocardia niigatensis]|uniref:NAD(P)/FAD-dependent oxidoreductase n=1 Tax=Nocardia niigatensis TaxID=209249 RepID=UPI001C3F4C7D|nr:FAD-dependent oxidoreductase [Nocardia niigatensis]